jgi:hypothetical protein
VSVRADNKFSFDDTEFGDNDAFGSHNADAFDDTNNNNDDDDDDAVVNGTASHLSHNAADDGDDDDNDDGIENDDDDNVDDDDDNDDDDDDVAATGAPNGGAFLAPMRHHQAQHHQHQHHQLHQHHQQQMGVPHSHLVHGGAAGQVYGSSSALLLGSLPPPPPPLHEYCIDACMYTSSLVEHPMIACDDCNRWYHFRCVSVPTNVANDEPWFCPACSLRRGVPPRAYHPSSASHHHAVMAAAAAVANSKAKALAMAGAGEASTADAAVAANMTDYERQRLANIRQRDEFFKTLGVSEIRDELRLPALGGAGAAALGLDGLTPLATVKKRSQAYMDRESKRPRAVRRQVPQRTIHTRRTASYGEGVDAATASAMVRAEAERAAAKQRASPSAVVSRSSKVDDLVRDMRGNIVFPFRAASRAARHCEIHALGRVDLRAGYHSPAYIWPIGFKSAVRMKSIVMPGDTMYWQEILDGGDAGPVFQVTPADAPHLSLTGSAPSNVWNIMLGRIRGRPKVSVSGPEMFGYADPRVKHLISLLPNADKCEMYGVATPGGGRGRKPGIPASS